MKDKHVTTLPRRSLLSTALGSLVGVVLLPRSSASADAKQKPAAQTLGGVNLSVARVSANGGTYSIEMVAAAEGKDVDVVLKASVCSLIEVSTGQTISAKYVSIGPAASGAVARATLLAGYKLPLTFRWSLDNPRLTELLRVSLGMNFDSTWHYLKFDSIAVDR